MKLLLKYVTHAPVAAAGWVLLGAAPAGQRPSFQVLEKTIPDLAAAMKAGTVSSKALVQSYLAAITVPAGFADDGMPVGVEFLGRPFAEPDLLKLAYAFE